MSEPVTNQGLLLKEYYFPTQIFFKDLPGAGALNTALTSYIYECREHDQEGIVRSNAPGTQSWHSALDMHHKEPFLPLVRSIMETLDGVFENLGYHPAYQPVCSTMWANVNPRNGFNRGHTHPGSLWSGVYYVQAPQNSGQIYFYDPRAQAHVILPRYRDDRPRAAEGWSEVYFSPVEGRLVVFPAWLLHEVQPNLTALEGAAANRISISFNIHQELKPGETVINAPGFDARGGISKTQLDTRPDEPAQ